MPSDPKPLTFAQRLKSKGFVRLFAHNITAKHRQKNKRRGLRAQMIADLGGIPEMLKLAPDVVDRAREGDLRPFRELCRRKLGRDDLGRLRRSIAHA